MPTLTLTDDPRQGARIELLVGNPGSTPSQCCLLIGDPIDPPLHIYGIDLLVDPTELAIPILVPPGGARIVWNVETGVDACGRSHSIQAVMLQDTRMAASERLQAFIGD